MLKFLLPSLMILMSANIHAQGLKKVDYQDKTIETNQASEQNPLAGASPEQLEKLMKDAQKIKSNQAEAQKYLEELDKE